MCLCETSQPSSHGPRWAEGALPGPTPMEPILRGHQAPSVARKMPTCLSHQSTLTINHHPLPTHAVAVLWGSCSSQSPSQGLGRSCWDPPGLPRFSREVAGCSDSRWASQRGCPCSLSPSPSLVQGLGEGILSHFLRWRWGRGLRVFHQMQVGPLDKVVQCVHCSKAPWLGTGVGRVRRVRLKLTLGSTG